MAPAGPVAERPGGGRAQSPGYVFRAQADTYWPTGIRARSVIGPWIADSRLRRLCTRWQGLPTTGAAVIDSQYRAVVPSRRRNAPRHPLGYGGDSRHDRPAGDVVILFPESPGAGVVPLPHVAQWNIEDSLMTQCCPVAVVHAPSGFEFLDISHGVAQEWVW